METANHSEEPSEGAAVDRTERVRSERHNSAARVLESRETVHDERLQLRQRAVAELRQHFFDQINTLEKEYQVARAYTKQRLDRERLDLDAACRSANQHCSGVGVQFVYGETTGETVLAVPLLEKAEAAKRLGLAYGTGFSEKLTKFTKPPLTVFCWLLASLSLGLLFHQLSARRLTADPLSLFTSVLSLAMGGVVSLGLLVAMTWIWTPVGTKRGFARPGREVFWLKVWAVSITALFFAGLAILDASAVVLLNAARAALNPTAAPPVGLALLSGAVLSGLYVIGLAYAVFAGGYTVAARENIDSFVKENEKTEREKLRGKVPFQLAMEAVGDVKKADKAIEQLETQRGRQKQEHRREIHELVTLIPEIPTSLEPAELQELADLAAIVDSKKAHLDAHLMSRGGPEGDARVRPADGHKGV